MKVTKKFIIICIVCYVAFCCAIMGVTIGMTFKAGMDSRVLLEESIKSQLLAITQGARDIVLADVALLESYDAAKIKVQPDYDDYENDPFYQQVEKLGQYLDAVTQESGLDKNKADEDVYVCIYVVRYIDGAYYLIFDTDERELDLDALPLSEYELQDVHKDAFKKKNSAGIMNLAEEQYGSFSTGAMPIFNADGKVVGIICTDIDDYLVRDNQKQFTTNIAILSSLMSVTLVALGVILVLLLRHVQKTQEELRYLANYDKLTNLPNRRHLFDHFAMLQKEKKQEPFALFFIDLDNFKKVNDNAGHDAGDALLQHVAKYLQSSQHKLKVFRAGTGSLNVTARVGGDEFVLLVPGIATAEDASNFAKEILDGFRHHVKDKNVELYEVGMSIGIALYPEDSENHHVLIKYADIAMYEAKKGGKNNYAVYKVGMFKDGETSR